MYRFLTSFYLDIPFLVSQYSKGKFKFGFKIPAQISLFHGNNSVKLEEFKDTLYSSKVSKITDKVRCEEDFSEKLNENVLHRNTLMLESYLNPDRECSKLSNCNSVSIDADPRQREQHNLHAAMSTIRENVSTFLTGNSERQVSYPKESYPMLDDNVSGTSKAEVTVKHLTVFSVQDGKVLLKTQGFGKWNQDCKAENHAPAVAVSKPQKKQFSSALRTNAHVRVPTIGSPTIDNTSGHINNFECSSAEGQSYTSKALDTATNVFNHTASRLKQYTSAGIMDSMQLTAVAKIKKEKMEVAMKRELISRGSRDRKTCSLVFALRDAQTSIAQLARLEELSQHLTIHPQSASIAVKNNVLPCLLKLRSSRNSLLRDSAREVLALIGHTDPVDGRGIRILSLDGGGTKGLISIEIMKCLESITQKRIYELFDYVCGVSTGALIAIMAGVFRVSLDETELMYKEFSSQMFSRNKLLGAGKLFMSHAYYDTEIWENILKENIGFKTFLQTTHDPKCPKIAAISVLMNVQSVENFVFRNYAHSVGRQSHYAGSLRHTLWEAIRASSAAPGYFEEFELAEYVHQDGGLLTNNPTAIAIHEAQLLWPNDRLQCVVSIGTGKYEPTENTRLPLSKTSLKSKVAKIVQSATDTEAVHTVLHDLLRPATYYRFNPYISEDMQLDEIRPDKWEQVKGDTKMYCRKNKQQLDLAAQRLVQPRPIHSKVLDWCNLKWNMIG